MPRWRDHEDYFWSLVKKSRNGCWEWQGDLSKGYGRIHKDGKRTGAHRVSYEYAIGPIPSGIFVCHKCDNRKCVRPDHLFLGTQKDNMQDWTKKGKNILINNPSLLRRGAQHWTRQKSKKSTEGRKEISLLRKKEWSSGRRTVIRDTKGRILGTRMAP